MQQLYGRVANPQCYDVYARMCVYMFFYLYIYYFIHLFTHMHKACAQVHTMLRVGKVRASYGGVSFFLDEAYNWLERSSVEKGGERQPVPRCRRRRPRACRCHLIVGPYQIRKPA